MYRILEIKYWVPVLQCQGLSHKLPIPVVVVGNSSRLVPVSLVRSCPPVDLLGRGKFRQSYSVSFQAAQRISFFGFLIGQEARHVTPRGVMPYRVAIFRP